MSAIRFTAHYRFGRWRVRCRRCGLAWLAVLPRREATAHAVQTHDARRVKVTLHDPALGRRKYRAEVSR